MASLRVLLGEIRNCRVCESELPLGPRPILTAHSKARILIIGQAPGSRVHESGVPWADASGKRLRSWMGITEDEFYDETTVALVPMGFCYPGTGKGGDLPPRRECAELWHDELIKKLKNVNLTLVIGQYAQKYWFKTQAKPTLTETIEAWEEYTPDSIPLPHPSPRNNRWLKRNPWFEKTVVPALRGLVGKAKS